MGFTSRRLDRRTIEHRAEAAGEVMSFAQVARGLREEAALRDALTRTIAEAPFPAMFWECAPVSGATRDRPFAMILMESHALTRNVADPTAFAGPIGGCAEPEVRAFDNLGRDARLVVPCGAGPDSWYAHVATFARAGRAEQLHRLWAEVGREVERWWADRDGPVWVSTSGLGVPWLHVRLDERPKYVCHAPYRRWPG